MRKPQQADASPVATPVEHASARAKLLFDAVPEAIVGVDDAGTIQVVNAPAVRLFGWSVDELVGQQIEVLVPTGIAEKHAALRRQYLDDPNARPMGAGLHIEARRKDGSAFSAEISLSPLIDENDTLLVLAAITDITARIDEEIERERRAHEVQRLESLGQLAGGVAHDFNNLLGVILNYATLVERRVGDPIALADLTEIRAAAERGAALTRQLLTFARRDVVHPEAINVNDVVSSVASMLARTIGEHIELNLALDDQPTIGMCDRTQLEQIVMNLAINARDAMPDGGILRIAAASSAPAGPAAQHTVVLTVSDTGHGMAPEVVARAFEPFFTTKPRGRGTGLGLATVYGIVEQNRGAVTIDSTVGRGTTVTVRLPGGDALPTQAEAEHAHIPQGNERILLVEDTEALRTVTARLLTERGYRVVVAADGIDALEVLDRHHEAVDLVVSDVAMPRMRGDELANALLRRTSPIPIIFMTGYDSGEAPLAGRVLSKPVAEDELMTAVREALDG